MRFPRSLALFALATAVLSGCRGAAPVYFGEAIPNVSAVLIRARITLPTGETKDGGLTLNLESQDDRYRLPFLGKRTSLLRVEPGIYRIVPPRTLFGSMKPQLSVRVEGKTYWAQFPREMLRLESVEVRPARVVALGVLDIKLLPASRREAQKMVIHFDRGLETRRKLVQDVISSMMDPKAPAQARESAITWTRALEVALAKLQAEAQEGPALKRAP
ncbi:MAG: hypothetical protein AAB576_08590 [Elusimicrobiota bacterium]